MKNLMENLKDLYFAEMAKGAIVLRTSIMYDGADHFFSFYIKQDGEGGYVITDNGQTYDYLRENFNPNKYLDKIHDICHRFEIQFVDGKFVGRLALLQSGQTARNIHTFIGAMHIIANIDIL